MCHGARSRDADSGRARRQLLARCEAVADRKHDAGGGRRCVGLRAGLGGHTRAGGLHPRGAIPREVEIGIDPAVLAFSLGLAIVTALAFGIAPALQLARRDIVKPLGDSGRGVRGGFRRGRLHSALVVIELALSLVISLRLVGP